MGVPLGGARKHADRRAVTPRVGQEPHPVAGCVTSQPHSSWRSREREVRGAQDSCAARPLPMSVSLLVLLTWLSSPEPVASQVGIAPPCCCQHFYPLS